MKRMTSAVKSGTMEDHSSLSQSHLQGDEFSESKTHLGNSDGLKENLIYNDAEHEPQLRFRTWVALAAMWLFNYVAVLALLSPPVVVSGTHLGFLAGLISVLDFIHRNEP